MIRRRALLAGALTAPMTSAHAATSWRIVTEYPNTSMPGEGITTYAAAAASLTAGAFAVRPAFDAPGGLRSAGMIRAVANGDPEAADAFTGALREEAPIFALSSLPFLTRSIADVARLLAIARKAYAAVLEARGLVLLYVTPWPATGLWSRAALDGPGALRGLRVRTYDAASTAVMAGAGARPSRISFADAAPLLRTGELDAVLSSGDGGAGARLWDVLPFFSALDYAMPLSIAFCGRASLALLPPEWQLAVVQAGSMTEARQFRAIATRQSENEARMREQGVSIDASPAIRAVLARAAGPVVADWTREVGEDGRAILADYLKTSG